MVNYLKKSRFRKLLLSLGYPVPALKDCSYKFYRGSEWLEFFSSVDGLIYKAYLSGYMSVESFAFNPEYDTYNISIQRDFYRGYEVQKFITRLV